MDGNKREADLRLDVREDALAMEAIMPGSLEDSEMYYRIHSEDEDEIMPVNHRILTAEQKKILDRWIKEGLSMKNTGHLLLR